MNHFRLFVSKTNNNFFWHKPDLCGDIQFWNLIWKINNHEAETSLLLIIKTKIMKYLEKKLWIFIWASYSKNTFFAVNLSQPKPTSFSESQFELFLLFLSLWRDRVTFDLPISSSNGVTILYLCFFLFFFFCCVRCVLVRDPPISQFSPAYPCGQ